MVLDLIQRDADTNRDAPPPERNFSALRDLVARCHEDDATKVRLLRFAALLVRSLYRAGVVGMAREDSGFRRVVVAGDLQWDFSLHQALSIFALTALERLDPASLTYAVDVVSVVESILENPDIVLRKQTDRAKGKLVEELKAEGVPYEERMAKLEEVTHPKPLADFLFGAFEAFCEAHPWAAGTEPKPKSIGREMFETFAGFSDYVKSYGLERSEGVLLRYLSQLYRTLDQTVPEPAKTDAVWDVLGFFRSLVGETDASLLEEWESLRHPEELLELRTQPEKRKEAAWLKELLSDPRVFAARVRAEMHLLVRALSRKDWEDAAERIWQPAEAAGTDGAAMDGAQGSADGGTGAEVEGSWSPERFERDLAPFFAEHAELVSGPQSRFHQWTSLRSTGTRQWTVTQTLLDPEGDNTWAVFAEIDLRDETAPDGPILRLTRIGA